MEITLGLIVQVAVGALTIAAAYGAIKTRLAQNSKDISELKNDVDTMNGRGAVDAEPLFVKRTECAETRERFEIVDKELKSAIAAQDKSVNRLLNFSRWSLTTKEGLTLAEANDILENGK